MIAFLTMLACDPVKSADKAVDDSPACTDDLTWENTGHAFALTYCTGCHSQHLVGGERKGALDGVNLDTLEGFGAWRDRARTRVVDDRDMPPGGGPSPDEIARFVAWIDCGADGAGVEMPTDFDPDDSLIESTEVLANMSGGGTSFTITRVLDGPPTEEGPDLWSEERYELYNDEAWFDGYTLYDVDGNVTADVTWSPPLLIVGAGSAAPQAVNAKLEDGSTVAQEWRVAAAADPVDARSMDPAARALEATEAGGERQLWFYSPKEGISGRAITTGDGITTKYLRRTIDTFPDESLVFPLRSPGNWVERVVVLDEEAR